jgi:serine/threonine-protein kinase RsbW
MADADPLSPQMALRFTATLADIRAALQTITTELRRRHAPSALVDDVNIVLGEVMTNIARHGYPYQTGWIDCMLTLHVDGAECRVTDAGVAYDPCQLGKSPSPHRLAEGGYGWALIHALSVGLRYDRQDGQNALRFVIPARAPENGPASG